MRVNKATMNMLVKVDPYIMYGYPNLKTVRHTPARAPHAPRTSRPPLPTHPALLVLLSPHARLLFVCAFYSTLLVLPPLITSMGVWWQHDLCVAIVAAEHIRGQLLTRHVHTHGGNCR